MRREIDGRGTYRFLNNQLGLMKIYEMLEFDCFLVSMRILENLILGREEDLRGGLDWIGYGGYTVTIGLWHVGNQFGC